MITEDEVIRVLTSVLKGSSGTGEITLDTQLMGAMPEFDSMAVVSILTQLEDDHGIYVEDDELEAEVFESVGTFLTFLQAQTAQ